MFPWSRIMPKVHCEILNEICIELGFKTWMNSRTEEKSQIMVAFPNQNDAEACWSLFVEKFNQIIA